MTPAILTILFVYTVLSLRYIRMVSIVQNDRDAVNKYRRENNHLPMEWPRIPGFWESLSDKKKFPWES